MRQGSCSPLLPIMIQLSWCRLPTPVQVLCDYSQGNKWLHSECRGTPSSVPVYPPAIEAIEHTMAPLSMSAEQHRLLEQLMEGAPVVISGQQVGFLGGPFYTWLKIAGTVEHARRSGAVPIFWIEDNDHDIKEAQRISLIDNEDHLLTLECPPGERLDRQMIVATCTVSLEIANLFERLWAVYRAQPFTEEVLTALAECYTTGRLWSEAFLCWLQWCWGDIGVLFIRSSILRKCGLMQPLIVRALEESEQFLHTVKQQTAELERRGYTAQMVVSNLPMFYHRDGRRYRIHASDDESYRAYRWRFSRNELKELIESQPEQFSPSAALRPLVQDWLFRPIVTVLGPAELSYHLQLRSTYDEWSIPKPSLIPRPSATVVPQRVMRLLMNNAEAVERFFEPEQTFRAWLAQRLDEDRLIGYAAQLHHSVNQQMAEFHDHVARFDRMLARSIASTQHVIFDRLTSLERKIRRSVMRRKSQVVEQYHRARVHLFPYNGLQERSIAPIHWLCKLGIDQWRSAVLRIATYDAVAHYVVHPDELLSNNGTLLANKQERNVT